MNTSNLRITSIIAMMVMDLLVQTLSGQPKFVKDVAKAVVTNQFTNDDNYIIIGNMEYNYNDSIYLVKSDVRYMM
jgi:hypothetical protein